MLMKKLLSLPPNLVDCFRDITDCSPDEWFYIHDPVGQKLGSSGDSTWRLLRSASIRPLLAEMTLSDKGLQMSGS